MGPGDLQRVLCQLEITPDPRLIVGISAADDAGVVRLSDDLALVQTVDFFTPIVDDPFEYGAIAAANALSDVYAMGGQPLAALNIVCFPSTLDLSIMARIIQGGYSKILEAGAVLAGGHSILDKEVKYGLAVTGTIHPDRIITNDRARPGDKLVLTKPIGTGILSTALKREMISDEDFRPAVKVMSELNRGAAEAMIQSGISAATDITGFGLLGHALEMACASRVSMVIETQAVPLLDGVMALSEKGAICGGTKRNLAHVKPHLDAPSSIPETLLHILADAQTSGGMLICADGEKLPQLLTSLEYSHVMAAVIGEVTADQPSRIALC